MNADHSSALSSPRSGP